MDMLIAESGSTKTEWRLCRDGEIVNSFRSRGFNPNVMPEEAIKSEIQALQQNHLPEENISRIFFYGAGTRGEAQNALMKGIFETIFPYADVTIGYDLLAAVRSTGRSEGMVCILGTGSSACLHSQGEIDEIRGGLGYLFGDEGSGADLGRSLIKAMLQGDLPDAVGNYVLEKEGMNLHDLKMAITRHPKPNVRMAVLAPFLREFLHLAEVFELVTGRFEDFLSTTVCRFDNSGQLPLDVIGSVGYYFAGPFTQACENKKITVGNFIKDPIEHLVNYHLRQQ
ncbi:MAG: hypothetical protein R3C61_19825 [Bacteroidia bacterium]